MKLIKKIFEVTKLLPAILKSSILVIYLLKLLMLLNKNPKGMGQIRLEKVLPLTSPNGGHWGDRLFNMSPMAESRG